MGLAQAQVRASLRVYCKQNRPWFYTKAKGNDP